MLFDQLASWTQTHFCVAAGFCKASVWQFRGAAELHKCVVSRADVHESADPFLRGCRLVQGWCMGQLQRGCGPAQMCGQPSCSPKRLPPHPVNVHISADPFVHVCRLAQKLVYGKIREALGVRRCVVSGGGSLQPHLDEFYEVLDLTVLNGWGLSEVRCCPRPGGHCWIFV